MDNTTRQAMETAATALWPETVLMMDAARAAKVAGQAWQSSAWKDAIRKLDPTLAYTLDKLVTSHAALTKKDN